MPLPRDVPDEEKLAHEIIDQLALDVAEMQDTSSLQRSTRPNRLTSLGSPTITSTSTTSASY
jgi:hypothetical protein